MQELSHRTYTFAGFTLDADRSCLTRDGLDIKLRPKSFDSLKYLIENRGRVVSKDELVHAVWPDSFVSDDSLVQCVKDIRRALDDNAQHYIKTVPRRGYIFDAEVVEDGCGNKATMEIGQISESQIVAAEENLISIGSESLEVGKVAYNAREPGLQSKTKAWIIACGSVVLVIVTGLSYWFSRLSPQPKLLGSSRLTNDRHQKLVATMRTQIVTDGLRLFFTEIRDNMKVIVQVSVGGGETIPIPTPLQNPEIEDLFPDGSRLLVTSSTAFEEQSMFWIVPLPAGSPYRLGDLQGDSPKLSPDGQYLVYARASELRVANSDGTKDRKLATVSGRPWWLRWSPDGTRIRFTLDEEQPFARSLWEVAPDGTGLHRLLPGWNDPAMECCGSWTPDGRYFLFESTHNYTNIWVVRDRTGLLRQAQSDPVQLTTGPMNFHRPVVSKDGRRLFVIGDLRRGELSRYDGKVGQWLPYLPDFSAEWLAFSPDGRFMSYASIPEGTLWKSKIDGTERQQLTLPPLLTARPQWSPDGKKIAFTATPAFKATPAIKRYAIYWIPAEGGIPEDLLPDFPNAWDLSWSPDGRSLIFGTFPDTKSKVAIYQLDLPSRKISKLPGSDGYWSPHWSPEGRYVHALKLSSNELVLFDFTTQKWESLTNFPVKHHESTRDGKYISFESIYIQGPAFFRVRTGGKTLERVVSVRDLRRTSTVWMPWAGLTLDDSPLIARDIGSQEIYALDWAEP